MRSQDGSQVRAHQVREKSPENRKGASYGMPEG